MALPASIRRLLRVAIEKTLLMMATRRSTLRALNAIYRRLGTPVHTWMQPRYAKLFRDGNHALAESRWELRFAGLPVVLPLHPWRAWLDWDAAFSLLGHESEIKRSYHALLKGPTPPDLFVDIGGNYGMHSLLFLVCGVEALTFEPNSACHDYFREVCSLNAVRPRLEHAALGAEAGEVELYFPERETWLGSLDPDVIAELRGRTELRVERVAVRTLDEYERQFAGRRVLLKIDAEGHESAVLRGAERTIRTHRPLVIFEVHGERRRARVLEQFTAFGYRLAPLPIDPGQAIVALGPDEFMRASGDDYMAIPGERFAPDGRTPVDALFGAVAHRRAPGPVTSPS
jgi:FkbM family methyltransferase